MPQDESSRLIGLACLADWISDRSCTPFHVVKDFFDNLLPSSVVAFDL